MSEGAKGARVLENVVEAKSGRPELIEAAIVVSGGRGSAQREGFEVVEQPPTRSVPPSVPRAR